MKSKKITCKNDKIVLNLREEVYLMDSKDMIVEVVYETKDGLFPLQIAEAVTRKYNIHMTTREVEQIVGKNPKLFVEDNGKIKSPTHY